MNAKTVALVGSMVLSFIRDELPKQFLPGSQRYR